MMNGIMKHADILTPRDRRRLTIIVVSHMHRTYSRHEVSGDVAFRSLCMPPKMGGARLARGVMNPKKNYIRGNKFF